MYLISQEFQDMIKEDGGVIKFSEKYDFKPSTIEGYCTKTRKIQLTTLISVAAQLEYRKKQLTDNEWIYEICKPLVADKDKLKKDLGL